jgi:single-strand DNA-binding protein
MSDTNIVVLSGRLTFDPELKFIPSGLAVCNLKMAVNRKWADKGGEKKEEACFVSVVCWGKQAEAAGEYLKKGSALLVQGRLKFKSWEKDGVKRTALEVEASGVQFLGGGPKAEGAAGPGSEDAGEPDIPF